MALAMMERFNLFKDSSTGMSRYLLDDLDCVLQVCQQVDTSLYWSVGSPSQHLTCQPVQVWKNNTYMFKIANKK